MRDHAMKRFCGIAAALLLGGLLTFGAWGQAHAAEGGSLVAGSVSLEALAEGADDSQTVAKKPMYRMYNWLTGEHFYTASADEAKGLKDEGWNYEGIGWIAPETGDPVYRLCFSKTGKHHYTTSADERDKCVKDGWTAEGVGWYSVPASDAARIPLYRQYNVASALHNYTISKDENDDLVKKGWRAEGTAWYGYAIPSDFSDAAHTAMMTEKKVPVYRMYNWRTGEHFYTTSKDERNKLKSQWWIYEGIGWLAPANGDAVYRLRNSKTSLHHYTTSAEERDACTKNGWVYEGVSFCSAPSGDAARVPLYRQYNPKSTLHNYGLSKEENDNLVKEGWKAEGTAWYGYNVPAKYIDDSATGVRKVSGDTILDVQLEMITSNRKTLRSCYDYVSALAYRSGDRFWSNPRYLSDATTIGFAKDMLAHNSGNCYRYASLFCWLARSLGYDAKVVSGWVPSYSGGQAPHGWVEIVQNGQTYVCDPDMYHEMRQYNWYMVTYASAPLTYGSW